MFETYVRKAAVIGAVKIAEENIRIIADKFGGWIVTERGDEEPNNTAMNFPTLEGPVRVRPGMYLVRLRVGGLQIMEGADFEAEYHKPRRGIS